MADGVMLALLVTAAGFSAASMYVILTRLKSAKREYLVLFFVCVLLYDLGHIFQMTAQALDGALIATKIRYIGSMFMLPTYLMFVQRYCEIRLPRAANALLFATAAAVTLLVLAVERNTLYYASYWYDGGAPVRRFRFEPGALYLFGVLHPVFCSIVAVVIFIRKMLVSGPDKRNHLIIITVCTLFPSVPHLLFVLNVSPYGLEYAPIFFIAGILVLYYGIFRYDLLDNDETIRAQTWFREMVANISHDLKTPLSVLSLNLETLSGLAATRGDARYRRHVRAAWQKNLDLQRLIQNLLEASRIETGRVVYAVKPESLHRLLSQMEEKYGAYLEDSGISFDIAVGDDVMILTDAVRVWSVFDNVIYNAARHTKRGGGVTVSARLLGERVEIAVTDTGSGISAEHLPRVFERFYKGSHSRGSSEGDSGLGLYIVKSVMEGCGGTVRAESGEGSGTSIILGFPPAC